MSQPIRHLFVANRGEIAARIRRTAELMGISVTLPATDRPGAVNLLDGGAVIAAALDARADALHPGYGFLSENADFATAVIASGMRWIGPPPAAMRALGDKAGARRIVVRLGVPVIPGYDGEDQHDDRLTDEAGAIGYPLLVKPSAGGGGKGMRVVASPNDLAAALAAARREALVAFGDDRLVLERHVRGPRHVEIQVLFDGYGRGVHLGERDCSLQRRHQKVLEESPSPAVSGELRERLGAAALTLADAVGYESAGTVEFLLEDDGSFWFLEMNTRLQVEHPVTELVTGRDLVADQLRIAAGERLEIDQAAVVLEGHAVEVRLYAEDAEAGFLPATGTVVALRWPGGRGIRVEAGISVGDEVGGQFDPMLAKIIAHGQDRAEALARLAVALDATVVLGLVTNLRFLRHAVRHPLVLAGEVRIDSLRSVWDGVAPPTAADADLAAAAALLLDDRDAWGGGWRLNALPVVRLDVGGREHRVEVAGPRAAAGSPVREGDAIWIDVEGRSAAVRLAPPPDVERSLSTAPGGRGAEVLTAPMPGRVVAVHVALNDEIAEGAPILTLEAMKMEHVIAARRAAVVTELLVGPGDQVARDQLLGRIE
jgi:acetyl/propionyl-CoA carboxylase alpha subunit